MTLLLDTQAWVWAINEHENLSSPAKRAIDASSRRHVSVVSILEIAQKVLKTQGPGAWPVCSRRAGLTRANGGAASASSSAAPTVTSRAAARPGKLVVDGKKGPATRRAIERWVGGSVNGSLSGADTRL